MMFQIGDMICYPMHGIGVVEDISDQNVLGQTTRYYMLRLIVGKMTAMVPVETAEDVGLRAIITSEECEKIVDYFRTEARDESDNWSQRYRDNLDRLRQGEIYGVTDVVKCLIRRDRQKGLSAGERKMYLLARQMLLTELAAASGREEAFFSMLLDE
jgi:CarD family transcriptional regulator